MRVRRILSLLALGLLSACGDESEPERHHIAAFGTEVVVTIRAGEHVDVAGAVAAVDRELQRMHRRWHAWEPGMLGDINRAITERRTIEIAPDAIAILAQARELERRSGGLFNPAIGRLLAVWGFHASELPKGPPPAASTVSRLVAQSPSMTDLEFTGKQLSSTNPNVQLDFGAYIKGVAIERALELLAEAGIGHAVVNAGGDLGAIGHHGSRPWRTAVQHPNGDGGRFLAAFNVYDGEFVFTSGNYRRYRQSEGIRHGHIIDPRDGYPADKVSSVTVIHDDGGEADAAATALAVAAPEEWVRIARDLGVEDVMRVDADGTIWVTSTMAARLQWQERPDTVRIVPATPSPP